MNDSFFSYLQQIELMAFFTGYPLVYALVKFIADKQPISRLFKFHAASLLPYAYALVGTIYLALQLKKLYPSYSIESIHLHIQLPLLTGWALLSILFWIPAIAKKPVLSLLHSLVFFFFLVKDIFFQSPGDKDILQNAMKIYTTSILLNLGAFLSVILICILAGSKKSNNSRVK